MIKFTAIHILVFLLFTSNIRAQSYNESNSHIFWDEKRILLPSDFLGDGSSEPQSRFFCDSLNICCLASLNIYTALDIPENEKDRGILFEHAYYVPIFDKTTSYIVNNQDPIKINMDIKKQQLVFDIYELSARLARKRMDDFIKSNNGEKIYGLIAIMFNTIREEAEQNREKLINSYTEDIYITKKSNAYITWRKIIDEELETLKDYATTTIDRQRAFTKKPINQNYIIDENPIISLLK